MTMTTKMFPSFLALAAAAILLPLAGGVAYASTGSGQGTFYDSENQNPYEGSQLFGQEECFDAGMEDGKDGSFNHDTFDDCGETYEEGFDKSCRQDHSGQYCEGAKA